MTIWLQWGRGRMAAEGAAHDGLCRRVELLQWGRGRMAAEGRKVMGATEENPVLQWGRGRMAAEGTLNGPAPKGAGSLQWGRGRMAAEGVESSPHARYIVVASMGPRPDGRGRTARRARSAARRRFNGAAAGWPRKVERGPFAVADWQCASMGPRPDGRGRILQIQARADASLLQWGRGRMAAEGPSVRRGADTDG